MKYYTFSPPSNKLRDLLQNNDFAKHISCDFKYYFKLYPQFQSKFLSNKDFSVMLLLKRIDTKRNQEVALIVSNREVKENLPYKVINYKTHVARDILTQVFHFDKTVISVDQIDYR